MSEIEENTKIFSIRINKSFTNEEFEEKFENFKLKCLNFIDPDKAKIEKIKQIKKEIDQRNEKLKKLVKKYDVVIDTIFLEDI